jgi:hypothetical protein
MANIANLPNTLRADGKWIRCGGCSKAYWGAFRATDFITAKFAAHVRKAHNPAAVAEAEAADAAADAPSDHADFVPQVVAEVQARQAENANGPVKVVRPAGPHTPVDPLADIAAELDPRLGLAQGPRMFPEQGGALPRRGIRKNANNGQAAVAAAQAGLSPLRGWAA